MAFVVSTGIGAALRLYADHRRVTIKILARSLGLSASSLHSLIKRNAGAPEAVFDRIQAALPKPWTRPYCEMSERPAVGWPIAKGKSKQRLVDKNVFRRIHTPSLDAFNGVPGGWC